MRLIVNDYSGHPFQIELSRELAGRGHHVLHLFSADFQTPKGDLTRMLSDPPTFSVEAVSLGVPFQKYNFAKRRGQEIDYSKLVCRHIDAFRPDVVIGCNNPLDAQDRIATACRKQNIPFVFWLQDIYSDAIKSILKEKLSILGALIGMWYQRMEKRLLCNANHIVAISDDFIPRLTSWNIRKERVSVIENWAPKNKINVVPNDNSWSRAHDFANKKIALYTGTIGLKHNPDLLLAVAEAFKFERDRKVVVISEGKYADYLTETARKRQLDNLTVLPFQSFNHYAEVLASGDVLIAMIEPEAAAYSVPSKVLSYLCSGRPIVLAADERNLAAKILNRSGAGIVVDPRDVEGFVAAVAYYLGDAKARDVAGQNARRYADEQFDIGAIANRFETVLANTMGSQTSNGEYRLGQ
jgi:putative colanic acid biosynthesis glycosyltransferase WcaI